MKFSAVILAAGQGVRMHSSLPKVLHPIMGKPMIQYACDAASQAIQDTPVVVVGHGGEEVRQVLKNEAVFALQEQQLGTGHAVQQAAPLLKGQSDYVLVTYGDMPLLSANTLRALCEAQRNHDGVATMLTVVTDDARGFGRVLRSPDGRIQGIVEEAQASETQLLIRELNCGVYCFQADWLWEALPKIQLSPKGEYYLTDLVGIAVTEGHNVQALPLEDAAECIGVNTRVHLAEVETFMRIRTNQEWMLAGVTLVDPQTTYISPDVHIGEDTTILPNTMIMGKTSIGKNCEIGPNTVIEETQIGDRCRIIASMVEFAIIEEDVYVGPFTHLRKGTHLAEGVHMGNFGEVKQSYLGPGTKMGHFSYVGDAVIGANVNIGCGTVTCNFDGVNKNHTEVEDNVFLGSDTMLVAPVHVGTGSKTGAGTVVTKDIPANSLAVGVPARIIRQNTSTDKKESC